MEQAVGEKRLSYKVFSIRHPLRPLRAPELNVKAVSFGKVKARDTSSAQFSSCFCSPSLHGSCDGPFWSKHLSPVSLVAASSAFQKKSSELLSD